MPRDLADVLHYFMPELGEGPAARDDRPGHGEEAAKPAPKAPGRGVAAHPTASIGQAHRRSAPLATIPIGNCDIVRAALAWNLAVEVMRFGVRVGVLTPDQCGEEHLFPSTAPPNENAGVVLRTCNATSLLQLEATALAFSAELDLDSSGPAMLLVRVPPSWLDQACAAPKLVRWLLLFSSSDPRDLVEAYGSAKRVVEAAPDARIGVTIHGARDLDQAQDAFEILAKSGAASLGTKMTRLGLVLDDLDIYRSITARRPIGLAHPHSPAAHALRDAARSIQGQLRDFAPA